MTEQEAYWAFGAGVMVSLEIDEVKHVFADYKCICEFGYRKKRSGGTEAFATCLDRFANSVTTAPCSAIRFARKEDEDRCMRELNKLML